MSPAHLVCWPSQQPWPWASHSRSGPQPPLLTGAHRQSQQLPQGTSSGSTAGGLGSGSAGSSWALSPSSCAASCRSRKHVVDPSLHLLRRRLAVPLEDLAQLDGNVVGRVEEAVGPHEALAVAEERGADVSRNRQDRPPHQLLERLVGGGGRVAFPGGALLALRFFVILSMQRGGESTSCKVAEPDSRALRLRGAQHLQLSPAGTVRRGQ